jgi:hypothetical protein
MAARKRAKKRKGRKHFVVQVDEGVLFPKWKKHSQARMRELAVLSAQGLAKKGVKVRVIEKTLSPKAFKRVYE